MSEKKSLRRDREKLERFPVVRLCEVAAAVHQRELGGAQRAGRSVAGDDSFVQIVHEIGGRLIIDVQGPAITVRRRAGTPARTPTSLTQDAALAGTPARRETVTKLRTKGLFRHIARVQLVHAARPGQNHRGVERALQVGGRVRGEVNQRELTGTGVAVGSRRRAFALVGEDPRAGEVSGDVAHFGRGGAERRELRVGSRGIPDEQQGLAIDGRYIYIYIYSIKYRWVSL